MSAGERGLPCSHTVIIITTVHCLCLSVCLSLSLSLFFSTTRLCLEEIVALPVPRPPSNCPSAEGRNSPRIGLIFFFLLIHFLGFFVFFFLGWLKAKCLYNFFKIVFFLLLSLSLSFST